MSILNNELKTQEMSIANNTFLIIKVEGDYYLLNKFEKIGPVIFPFLSSLSFNSPYTLYEISEDLKNNLTRQKNGSGCLFGPGLGAFIVIILRPFINILNISKIISGILSLIAVLVVIGVLYFTYYRTRKDFKMNGWLDSSSERKVQFTPISGTQKFMTSFFILLFLSLFLLCFLASFFEGTLIFTFASLVFFTMFSATSGFMGLSTGYRVKFL